MLIVEDLFLLLTNDDSGKTYSAGGTTDYALAGSLLLEMLLERRVRAAVDPKHHGALLRVVDTTPTGDPLFDHALEAVAKHDGERLPNAIPPLHVGLRDRLHESLVGKGILRVKESKILGIIPYHAWPAQDTEHEHDVAEQVAAVLVDGAQPSERIGALIAALAALGAETLVVDPEAHGVPRRVVRQRASAITDDADWAPPDLRVDAQLVIGAINSTIMSYTTVPVVPF